MKKQLVASLAAAMVLGVAGTSFAASNPFTDVPANSWAYASVQKLVQAGIIDGEGNGKFDGSRVITRYEMATMVAKAMSKEDKANAMQKAELTKLEVEFADELQKIGVRLDKLEKNASTIKITGFDQQRYQQNDTMIGKTVNGTTTPNGYRTNNNVKLNVSGNINDNMSFFGGLYMRIQDTDANDANGGGDTTREGDLGFYNAYVNMKNVLPASNLQLGRLHVNLVNGLMFGGDYFDGGQLTFGGDKVKGLVGYGDYTYMPGPDFLGNASASTNITSDPVKANIAQLQYVLSKNTSVYAAYMASANNVTASSSYMGVAALGGTLYKDTDFGFTSNLTPKLQLLGEYAKNGSDTVSNLASGDTTAWFAGVKLGNADMKAPGSSDLYARYLRRGANAIDWRASLNTFNPTFKIATDIQGPIVGCDLAVAPNVLLNLEYDKFTQYSTTTNSGDTNYGAFYQVALNFTF